MPFIDVQGGRHYYRLDGTDGRPVIALSHSLGLDHGMWDAHTADLLPHVQVLRYDTRGHGASEATAGDYTIEQLGRDVLGIADALGIERFAFCGLSLGGMIGQWLGAHAPDRVTHLVLANSSPRLTDPGAMETRRRAVLDKGMAAIVGMILGRFFSPPVLQSNPPVVGWARRTLLATNPAGYAGCCAAIRDMDLREAIGAISAPTLIVSGDRDVSTPWVGNGEVLARSIRGAKVLHLPAAHISNLERPRAFTVALLEFLLPPADSSVETGTKVRRTVLGDEHVDHSLAAATDFTADFQELITRFAWGTVWARPGLDYRTRRLLVLAMTAALGRWEEFRLHARSGFAAGLELSDVKEVLLQVAVYGGVPAANTGFQIAAEEHASAGDVRP